MVRRFSRAFTAVERRLVRRGRPTVGGWVAGGVPVLLLTTTGRRSGLPRTVPLLYDRTADGALLLVAVNGTADWHPDWFHNLAADPAVVVEIDGARTAMSATICDEAERADRWAEVCAAFPGLAPAQAATRRPIPLVRLASTDPRQ